MRGSFAFLVVALLAAGCAGSSHAAQLHRHYFLVGKRECAQSYRVGQIHPTNLAGVTWYGGVMSIQVSVGTKGIPKPYRRDVVAGCNAAG
jgi:hypothetical protein